MKWVGWCAQRWDWGKQGPGDWERQGRKLRNTVRMTGSEEIPSGWRTTIGSSGDIWGYIGHNDAGGRTEVLWRTTMCFEGQLGLFVEECNERKLGRWNLMCKDETCLEIPVDSRPVVMYLVSLAAHSSSGCTKRNDGERKLFEKTRILIGSPNFLHPTRSRCRADLSSLNPW